MFRVKGMLGVREKRLTVYVLSHLQKIKLGSPPRLTEGWKE